MHPTYTETDPFPCAELGCEYLDAWTLQECRNARCCWVYVRRREEDQAARDIADAMEKERRNA